MMRGAIFLASVCISATMSACSGSGEPVVAASVQATAATTTGPPDTAQSEPTTTAPPRERSQNTTGRGDPDAQASSPLTSGHQLRLSGHGSVEHELGSGLTADHVVVEILADQPLRAVFSDALGIQHLAARVTVPATRTAWILRDPATVTEMTVTAAGTWQTTFREMQPWDEVGTLGLLEGFGSAFARIPEQAHPRRMWLSRGPELDSGSCTTVTLEAMGDARSNGALGTWTLGEDDGRVDVVIPVGSRVLAIVTDGCSWVLTATES
jgi:hypothetical protein